MNQSSPFRLAIVGLGRVTRYYWPALERISGLTVAGVCDRDIEKVNQWNHNQTHCPAFNHLQDLYQQVNPDAFVVATSSPSHYSVTQALLPVGKPILLEKPATSSAADFAHLMADIANSPLSLVMAFHSAFAPEVLWFLDGQERLESEYGKITGFFANFYDPYVVNGQLQPQVNSLISSWMDSGINALSVIGKLVDRLQIIESYFTQIPSETNLEIHSHVSFNFSIESGDRAGRGWIETHWGLGLNRKITRLQFSQTGHEIILDHTQQQVRLINPLGESQILANCAGDQGRMVSHYQGVFADFYAHLQQGTDNLEFSRHIHNLLYSAYQPPYNLTRF